MHEKRVTLNNVIGPGVQALGYEYLGCEIASARGGILVRVYIDKDTGISLADCEKVSRHLGNIMDVEEPIQGKYTLEISSPGIERPLFTIAQYQRFVGYPLKIRIFTPIAAQRNFSGVLDAVSDDTICLKVKNELITFKFSDIEKGHLIEKLAD